MVKKTEKDQLKHMIDSFINEFKQIESKMKTNPDFSLMDATNAYFHAINKLYSNFPNMNFFYDLSTAQNEINKHIPKLYITSKVEIVHTIACQLTERFCPVDFSESDKQDIANIVTFECLTWWLENDKESYQTCSRFISEKYSDHDTKEKMSKRLYYAEKYYIKNITEQNKQAKSEGLPFKKINLEERQSYFNENDGRAHNQVTLAFIDMMASNYLELYKSLCIRKRFLVISEKNEGIKRGYDEYKKLLCHLNTLSHKINKPGSKNIDKEFVTYCMQYAKLERTNRFTFTAKLAKYMRDNNIDVNLELPEVIKLYISRILYPCQGNLIIDTLSPFIKDYDNFIEQAFHQPQVQSYLFIDIFRYCCGLITAIYKVMFPLNSLHHGHWTDKEYADAANFLKNKYQICKCFTPLTLENSGDNGVSYYKDIRSLYQNPSYFDQNLLRQARSSLKP